MSVTLQLRGRLAELRRRQGLLAIKADAAARSIKAMLATAAVDDLADVNAEGVLSMAQDLRRHRQEYLRLGHAIAEIRKELGDAG